MNRLIGRPIAFVHRFMHSHAWVSSDVPSRVVVPGSGVFEDYIDYFHHNCREHTTWMGKKSGKFPSDAWVYQEILFETRPDVVVEVGNWYGASTLFLANMLELIGKGRVIGIDIDHSLVDFNHPRITWITGDANSDEVLSGVRSLISPGERVMVIEDSSHTYENTLSILRNYCGMVSPGMYFIVEDGLCKYPFIEDGPKPGPSEAIHDFLKENRSFFIDKSREKFVITYNPDGYLKRTG